MKFYGDYLKKKFDKNETISYYSYRPCPQDCQLTEWSEWSSCQQNCDQSKNENVKYWSLNLDDNVQI